MNIVLEEVLKFILANALPTGVSILLVIQIRDFEYSPEAEESRKQELAILVQDQETMRSSLLQWCYASYGEVYIYLVIYF